MQATETQSHKWYLYLRGLNNEDIGHIVKKVSPNAHVEIAYLPHMCHQGAGADGIVVIAMQAVFNLHPTFPNPQREVTAPPFEIEEHGWGEFEVNVVVRRLTRLLSSQTAVLALHLSWCLKCIECATSRSNHEPVLQQLSAARGA